jgi:hypothetical protein
MERATYAEPSLLLDQIPGVEGESKRALAREALHGWQKRSPIKASAIRGEFTPETVRKRQ